MSFSESFSNIKYKSNNALTSVVIIISNYASISVTHLPLSCFSLTNQENLLTKPLATITMSSFENSLNCSLKIFTIRIDRR